MKKYAKIRRNVVSLKKSGMSEVEKRPVPKLKQRRTDLSGDYNHDYS